MDEQTRMELTYIKESIDEIKTGMNSLLSKKEENRNLISELQKDLILHCNNCENNRANFHSKIKSIETEISTIKDKPNKIRMAWGGWIAIIIGTITIVGFLWTVLSLFLRIIQKLGG